MSVNPLDVANIFTGLIDPAIALADRFAFWNDPVLYGGTENAIARYNQFAGQNPYGDVMGGWGGQFGTYGDTGAPVGVGAASAYDLINMFGQSPYAGAVSDYQRMGQMERPWMADSTGGLSGLLGRSGSFAGGYQNPMFSPTAPAMGGAMNPNAAYPGSGASGMKPLVDRYGNTLEPYQGWMDDLGDLLAGGRSGGGGTPAQGGLQPAALAQGGVQNPYGSFNGAWFSGGGVTQPSGGSSSNSFSPATPSNANLPWLKSAGGGSLAPVYPMAQSSPRLDRAQVQSPAYSDRQIRPVPRLAGPAVQTRTPAVPLGQPPQWSTANSGGTSLQTGQQPAQTMPRPQVTQPRTTFGAQPQVFQSYLSNPVADVNAARSTMAAGPYGQLMAHPQSFTPQVVQDLLRTGETDINQQAMGQRRQMLEAAAPGTAGGGVMGRQMFDLESGRQNAVTQLGRDVRTQAALQNFQDLMGASGLQAGTEQALAGLGLQGRQGAAGLQLGAEQALADLMLRENTLRQQMYNTDFSNMGRMVDSTAQFGAADQTRRMQLWQQLQGLMNQGLGLPDYYLDRAMQREAARLMPSAVSQMPATAFGAGGGYGGYSDGGGGNGFADAMPDLMAAMGMWASNRWGGS